MNQILVEQENNTRLWQLEYNDMLVGGIPFIPSDMEAQDDGADMALRPGTVVMFPAFDFASALIVGFHRRGGYTVVPVSPYRYPSMDFELRLPGSGYVLETWNTRVIMKDDVGEMVPQDRIKPDELSLVNSHYHYVFECRPFFSSATGKMLKTFSAAETEELDRYIEEQSEIFPDDSFIVLDSGSDLLSELFESDEGSDDLDDTEDPADDEVLNFPGTDMRYHKWTGQEAAASKDEDDLPDDLL